MGDTAAAAAAIPALDAACSAAPTGTLKTRD